MASYSFSSREIAETLADVGRKAMAGSALPQEPTGRETIFVKTPLNGIAARSGDVCTAEDCTRVFLSSLEFSENDALIVPVVNTTEELVEGEIYISVTRVGVYWVFDGVAGGEVAPKRVKFKLNAPLYNVATGFNDGNVAATVIDPMNSGLLTGDIIQVYDFQKQFEFTQTDSIGIAVKSAYGGDDNVSIWHIESCTQLVKRALIDLSGDLAPFLETSVPSSTFTQSMSDWPHVLWATSRDYEDEGGRQRVSLVEGIGQPVANLKNPHNFVAASGWAIVERRPSEAVTQSPDNQINPYNVTEVQDWEWHIVDVENEVAEYVKTKFDGTNFKMDISGTNPFANGVNPTSMTAFVGNETCNPPEELWADFTTAQRVCHVPNNTLGWAYLNKNTGNYNTIMTNSALFGNGEKVKAVANLQSEAGALIVDHESDCGKFRFKTLINMIVFGNTDSGDSCEIKLDPVPDLEVDVFAQAQDVEVVTSVAVNANGDLEMERSTIKACESTGTNQTIPLTSMDVINDVYCSNNLLTKDYSTIKFLGSTVSSSTGVSLPCTNPANYNWETIFNNYVWNQGWWNVNYYDITFPYGCEPCETGCCTGGTYDGQEVTEYDCMTVGGGTSWSSAPCPTGCCTGGTYDGQDVTEYDCMTVGGGTSWSSSPCSGDCCCENVTVSQCDFGSPTSYDDGMGSSIGFTATNLIDNGDCTWTQSGNWSSNFDSSTPAGSYTLSYDDATCTWSISGAIPSPYGGTVSGSAVDCACDGTSTGSNTLDISISGTHASFMGPASYSGTVRINFTGTDCT
jgi:hypothetical protein